MENFLAHILEKQEHTLKEHLIGVENIIKDYNTLKEYENYLKTAAIAHDLGKYSEDFQKYLLEGGKRGSVKHAYFGAILVSQLNSIEVAMAVYGHHSGLPDYETLQLENFVDTYEKINLYKNVAKEFKKDLNIEIRYLSLKSLENTKRERDVITRYIFSSLVDADWLDTERFMDREKSYLREHKEFDIENTIKKTENYLKKLENMSNELNILRKKSKEYAVSKAILPVGFFSLNLPTGLGKTLTSFLWALYHAKRNGLKRIIIVLPYVNIIDQTSEKLKEILEDDSVLEHHSSANLEIEGDEKYNVKRLATENWDYPIIVTTTVQFFETLFSNKTFKCRKFHNIANSVVIFDEVQTLEKNIVSPTLDMLKDIGKIMKVSFLFCTATEPAFEKRDNFDGIKNITSLVENAKELFEKTIRVRYILINELEEIDFDKLVKNIIEKDKSTLVVVNSKNAAREIYDRIKKAANNFSDIYHLSTNMYPIHRKKILKEIKNKIKNKICLISTQLIEAGVDLDFDICFREIAPLSSIIQAAGRCNREGRFNEGKVYIFNLENALCPPGLYQEEKIHTLNALKIDGNILYSHDYFKTYYSNILSLYSNQKRITEEREKLNFRETSKLYKVIDNITDSILISDPNNDENQTLINKVIKSSETYTPLRKKDYALIQQYSVGVYESFMKKARGLYKELNNGIKIWTGSYGENTGIELENDYNDYIL